MCWISLFDSEQSSKEHYDYTMHHEKAAHHREVLHTLVIPENLAVTAFGDHSNKLSLIRFQIL